MNSLFLLATLLALGLAAAPPPERPNIVLILADDLGYGDLGCYGADDSQTPHLDRLAQEGMRFTQFYASSALCAQTRAALIAGRWPDMAVHPGASRSVSQPYLIRQAVPLSRVLKQAGYRTALIGKWHLGETPPNTPNDCGFDEFYGLLGPMVKDYFTHAKQKGTAKGLWHNFEPLGVEGHVTDLLTSRAVEFIESQARSAPFFLYLAYNAPHSPIQPHPDWLAKVARRLPASKEHRRMHLALIEHMDDGVGRVLSALKKTGAADRTLVLFSSDNGGNQNLANNGGLRGAKRLLYEGGIRVPLCATWSGRIQPGSVSKLAAVTMDLYATLAEAADVKLEHPVESRSILRELRGGRQDFADRFFIWYVPDSQKGGPYQGQPVYAIRQGPWKLVQPGAFQPMELYNLEEDPRESRPVDHSHPAYRRLSDALRDHLIRLQVVPWSDKPPLNQPPAKAASG